ncbi:hypothetical protein BT93_K1557 [Corymbia citriodora subsp. variegata]|nr:hypothetical protein BT93_K1557 [Corymbia citriodora subsp. variegata]
MASMDGLVPITRSFLASYYDKYSFPPLSEDLATLSSRIRSLSDGLLEDVPPTEGERLLIEEADRTPPHKIDENMWKNREQMEEIVFLLEKSHWPTALQQQSTTENTGLATLFSQIKDKFQECLSLLTSFQAKNSERVFNTVMTYLPQDFRGHLLDSKGIVLRGTSKQRLML